MRRRKLGISPERGDAAVKAATLVFENMFRESHSLPKIEDPVQMATGEESKITQPDQVLNVLKLEQKDWPRRPGVLSVSVHGLWTCTRSSDDVATWFAGRVKSYRMIEGQDWVGDSTAECLALFVPLSRARQMIDDTLTNAGDAARSLLDASMRVDKLLTRAAAAGGRLKLAPAEPVELAAEPVAPAAASPEPEPGTTPGASEEAEEPWAEAFDFGRLVPVSKRQIGGVLQPTVIARDVHTFLEAGRDFTTWAKCQIERCSLSEGADVQKGNLPKSGEVSGSPAL